jgi:hypothetical protein
MRAKIFGFIAFTSAGILSTACDRSEAAGDPTQTSASTAAIVASGSIPAALAPSVEGATCPEGRWEYDYSDRFLESLANSANSRVVRERGKFICTISGRQRGSYVCEVTEGGVENVFEANTGGPTMTVTIRMNGRSKVDFEPAGPNRWRTTQSELSTLEIKASATVAGRTMPMPAMNLFPGFDRAGTILEYRCEGETLRLKPEVEGLNTDWAVLKRIH